MEEGSGYEEGGKKEGASAPELWSLGVLRIQEAPDRNQEKASE